MNRVLFHLRECSCERRRRRLNRAQEACDLIQQVAGNLVEANAGSVCDEDDHSIHFHLTAEIQPTSDYAGAPAHLARELRRITHELTGACDRLEGGVE